MAPSSSFALSLKPNVAYLALNLLAFWKKQMTSPSFAYANAGSRNTERMQAIQQHTRRPDALMTFDLQWARGRVAGGLYALRAVSASERQSEAVPSSAGKRHSILRSSIVTSREVPNVANVERKRSSVAPARKFVVRSEHAHAHAPVVRDRQQMGNRRKTGPIPDAIAVRRIIDAAQIEQLLEAQVGMIAQNAHCRQII